MPLYDFKCEACGEVFEKIVPSSISVIPHFHPFNPDQPVSLAPTLAYRQLSAPGGIKANGANGGMVLSEAQMKKIKEPVYQDTKTGAVTSAF